ncbi:EamA family transporter RarD [Pseudomonas oryzae]|uniref:Chloramphenicol-sensitive protein RarD n=1 Tax=Pseudomonas oryzae TaxID=1392877 RepID=A0A1H1V0U8_9PSED|nr:EamA family transporter RarD [Pseudomonas oryzae]SDS78220.1 chloramphenicol-sensitive protein RarD [Pseudomonas oryzae]
MILSGRGVLLSISASLLFSLIPGYVLLLEPLDGTQIIAQRVLWSLPAVLLLMLAMRQLGLLRQALERLRREPRLLAALILSGLLMGVQWAVFIWAPLTGHTLDVALGYFLLPLALVLTGRLFYGERLRPLQVLAVCCAAIGVLHELWLTRAFSIYTALSALGYVPYFMLRRWMRLDALSGLVLEMLVLVPLALLVIGQAEPGLFDAAPRLWWLLAGLGVLSALAFATMLAASRLLPMGLFGILSYVEPALLFVVAVTLLGEAFSVAQLLTYGPIWLAVLLVGLDSAHLLRRQLRGAEAAQYGG